MISAPYHVLGAEPFAIVFSYNGKIEQQIKEHVQASFVRDCALAGVVSSKQLELIEFSLDATRKLASPTFRQWSPLTSEAIQENIQCSVAWPLNVHVVEWFLFEQLLSTRQPPPAIMATNVRTIFKAPMFSQDGPMNMGRKIRVPDHDMAASDRDNAGQREQRQSRLTKCMSRRQIIISTFKVYTKPLDRFFCLLKSQPWPRLVGFGSTPPISAWFGLAPTSCPAL